MSYQIRIHDATGSLRFAAEMHSTLDPRYYPRGVRDTFIATVFDAWGDQLFEADEQITRVYLDQFVETARVSPHLPNRSSTKLYDNFGLYVGPDVISYQDPEIQIIEPTGSGWQGYRKQVDYSLRAAYTGGSRAAVESLGYAYSGMAPIIETHHKVPRWKLAHATGTVGQATARYLISASSSWGLKNLWRGAFVRKASNPLRTLRVTKSTSNRLYFDEEQDVSRFFSVGDAFTVSFSYLGRKTPIYDNDSQRVGITINFWVPGYDSTGSLGATYFESTHLGVSRKYTVAERKESITAALRDFLPGHVRPQVVFQDRFTLLTGAATWGSGTLSSSSHWQVESSGLSAVRIGATCSWVSPSLDLGAHYVGWAWYPDWMAEVQNDASIQVKTRFANSAGALPTASWFPVTKNAPIANAYVGRYAQMQLIAEQSSSLDIKIHAAALKGVFKSPSSFMGTMPRGAERAYPSSSVPVSILGASLDPPYQYGELIE